MENNQNRENQHAQRPKKQETGRIDVVRAILDEIENKINEAKPIPLLNTSMVKSGELLECMSRLRTAFTDAFAQADGIVAKESSILETARAEADKMANQAEHEVNKAQEEKERILKEAEAERSAVLARAQKEYDEKIALALNRENIVQKAQEEVRRCAVQCDEMVLDAQKQAEQIVKDAEAEEQRIIDDARKQADALYKQASEQADKAVSGAIAAVNAYSVKFDNGANAIVDELRNVQHLVELLNDSGNQLGGFAKEMAERRDRLLHPEYFEE